MESSNHQYHWPQLTTNNAKQLHYHAIRTKPNHSATLRHYWGMDSNQITTYQRGKLNMKYTKQQVILAFTHEKILAIRTKIAFTRLIREMKEKQA